MRPLLSFGWTREPPPWRASRLISPEQPGVSCRNRKEIVRIAMPTVQVEVASTPAKAPRFLRACHREPVDATPVWFMRQAGRCLADYRQLRKRYGILELAKTPDLAAEVTLMPVRAFGVDAAVLFADIM